MSEEPRYVTEAGHAAHDERDRLRLATGWAVWVRWAATLPFLPVFIFLAIAPLAIARIADAIEDFSLWLARRRYRLQLRRNHWIMTGRLLKGCPECGSFRTIDNGTACGSCGCDLPEE